MNYEDIPEYETYKTWKNANGNWEVKLLDGWNETVLHLVEDEDASDERIENGLFYLSVENGVSHGLSWIREREAFEMEYDIGGKITDADYVSLWDDGTKRETQHNHVHLDRDVQTGTSIPLSEA